MRSVALPHRGRNKKYGRLQRGVKNREMLELYIKGQSIACCYDELAHSPFMQSQLRVSLIDRRLLKNVRYSRAQDLDSRRLAPTDRPKKRFLSNR